MMHVVKNQPNPSAVRWMGCPRVTITHSNEVYDEEEPRHKEPLIAAAQKPIKSLFTLLVSSFTFVWLSYRYI